MRNCSECGSGLSPEEHVGRMPNGDFLCEVCDGYEPFWAWMLREWQSVALIIAFVLILLSLFYWIPGMDPKAPAPYHEETLEKTGK